MLDRNIDKVERIIELTSNSGKKEQFRVGDVVDTLWFNAMPESNRYKNVQAFNVVTLWIVAIVLIIKLVTM